MLKIKKSYQIIVFITICILLNYFGKEFAKSCNLPLWLDSFGTVLTAYVLGPFCGAVVGLAGNLMYGFQNIFSFVYGLTSISIGIIVGLAAKRKMFDTLFGAMSVSVIVTLISVLISTPLNWFIHNGDTGNMWGNGVVGFLTEQGFVRILAVIIGEFYIDFLDKVIICVLVYILIKLFNRTGGNDSGDETISKAANSTAIMIFAFVLAAVPCKMSYAGNSSGGVNNDYLDYVQTIYNSNNGLPCGTANCIAETNDGILWIGTYAGLYRYNGSEFRWMNEYDSVRNVNCMYVDAEGRLWIGTNDNGLSICINEDVVDVLDDKDGIASNSVRSIVGSSDGYYYIGTSGHMQMVSLENGIEIVSDLKEVNYASSTSADDEGNVAAVTSSGEMFLLNDGKIVTSIKIDSDQELFTCATFDENGFLYVGTSENHIYVYKIENGEFINRGTLYSGNLIYLNNIIIDEDNRKFVCADNGIGYFDNAMVFHGINTNEFNNSIDYLEIDYQNNLWFSSSRLGLLRLAKSSFTDLYGTIGIEKKVVNSVVGLDDKLYVGTDAGLDIIDTSFNSQVTNDLTEMLDGIRIRCVRTDPDGHLWICTYGKGLVEISKNGDISTYDSVNGKFGDWVRMVTVLSDGSIAASGDVGVAKIASDDVVWLCRGGEEISVTSSILCLLERKDGTIYAGSDGEGISVIKDGKEIKTIKQSDGLSSDVILRIVEDTKDDGVFIVTSNGLCYMDKDDNVKTLDNFPYYNNYDMWHAPGGKVFVLGSAGIYVVDRDDLVADEEDISYDLLDAKKGFTSSLTPNSWDYVDESGYLYLSCDNGLYKTDIRSYASDNVSYRMRISTVKVDNVINTLERGTPFVIARGTGRIEINPEVINFSIDNPYVSYYLEGFDQTSTIMLQSDLSSIVYTNLPTGEYTFHMKVLGSDKESVLEEATYKFIKEKEVYDNTWFIAYIIIVAMMAVAWFTWLVVRTQVQRTLNLQKKELGLAKQQLQMGNETILAIAKTVDAKDVNTSQHSRRVSEYSVMIAKELGFSDEECENLRKAALLHDIGKIGIPDRILNKPERLTDEEYAVMKSHVTRGAEILKEFTLIDHVVEGAQYHHERYDGHGYVSGLSGENIPIYGRIIGVADAFDAMTANRIYRKKLDLDFVLNELRRCRGTQFDPNIADIMLRLVEDGTIDVYEIYHGKPVADAENEGNTGEDNTDHTGGAE